MQHLAASHPDTRFRLSIGAVVVKVLREHPQPPSAAASRAVALRGLELGTATLYTSDGSVEVTPREPGHELAAVIEALKELGRSKQSLDSIDSPNHAVSCWGNDATADQLERVLTILSEDGWTFIGPMRRNVHITPPTGTDAATVQRRLDALARLLSPVRDDVRLPVVKRLTSSARDGRVYSAVTIA